MFVRFAQVCIHISLLISRSNITILSHYAAGKRDPARTVNTPPRPSAGKHVGEWVGTRKHTVEAEIWCNSLDSATQAAVLSRELGRWARRVRGECETNGFIALAIIRHTCVWLLHVQYTWWSIHRLCLQDAHVAYEQHTHRIQLPHSMHCIMHAYEKIQWSQRSRLAEES